MVDSNHHTHHPIETMEVRLIMRKAIEYLLKCIGTYGLPFQVSFSVDTHSFLSIISFIKLRENTCFLHTPTFVFNSTGGGQHFQLSKI